MKSFAIFLLLLVAFGPSTLPGQQTQDRDADRKPAAPVASAGKKDAKKEISRRKTKAKEGNRKSGGQECPPPLRRRRAG